MKKYLQQHMLEFEAFCKEENISVEKILSMPKCYSKNLMYIQNYNYKNADMGLTDNTPADILLIIKKNNNKIDFEITPIGKKLLKNDKCFDKEDDSSCQQIKSLNK